MSANWSMAPRLFMAVPECSLAIINTHGFTWLPMSAHSKYSWVVISALGSSWASQKGNLEHSSFWRNRSMTTHECPRTIRKMAPLVFISYHEHLWCYSTLLLSACEYTWAHMSAYGDIAPYSWVLVSTHEHLWWYSTLLLSACEYTWAHMSAYENLWECICAEMLHLTIHKKC